MWIRGVACLIDCRTLCRQGIRLWETVVCQCKMEQSESGACVEYLTIVDAAPLGC